LAVLIPGFVIGPYASFAPAPSRMSKTPYIEDAEEIGERSEIGIAVISYFGFRASYLVNLGVSFENRRIRS